MLEYKKKVVLIGSFAVGKTALIYKFVQNKFIKDYKATIGVNIMTKSMEMGNATLLKFSVWDIAGQLAFKPVWKNFYNHAAGALIIFDVTRQLTFDEVPDWYENIFNYVNERIPAVLIANKVDLKDERLITNEMGKELADRFNIEYMETSAKEGTNVDDAFKILGMKLLNLKPKLQKSS